MYGYYDNNKENFIPTYSSVYTDITSLPKYVSDAFIAIEDETFYDNSGISLNRLLYATFQGMLLTLLIGRLEKLEVLYILQIIGQKLKY